MYHRSLLVISNNNAVLCSLRLHHPAPKANPLCFNMASTDLTALFSNFIHASHILYLHGILDGYGHISFRNPNNASTFFMARAIAPALVSSPEDIVEYLIEDASPIDPNAPRGFIERYIHSEILKKFPGINSVVHSHSSNVVPFSVTGVPLRAIVHMAGFLGMWYRGVKKPSLSDIRIGEGAPVFDISQFHAPSRVQDLLIRNIPLGAALASAMAKPNSSSSRTPDYSTVLLQNHGFVTAATSIELAVMQAYYTQVNAQVQSTALGIQSSLGGAQNGRSDVRLLSTEAVFGSLRNS